MFCIFKCLQNLRNDTLTKQTYEHFETAFDDACRFSENADVTVTA